MLRKTTTEGYLKKTRVQPTSEAADDASAMKFMDAKFGNQVRQVKDVADSLLLAEKQKDDTRALHDLSMLVELTRRLVTAMGWGKEAAPLHKLGKELMQAAKDQGISER